MRKLKRLGLLTAFSFACIYSFSQQMNLNKEEPTDFMHSNGKIYVVVAVVVVIVTGIFIYLLNLDKRMRRLEKNNDKKISN